MSGGGGGGPSRETKLLQQQQLKELNELRIREWKAKNAILRGRRGRASLIRNEGGEAGLAAGDARPWTPRKPPKVKLLPKPELAPIPPLDEPAPRTRSEAMRNARKGGGAGTHPRYRKRAG